MQASARLSSSAAFRKVIAGVSSATARSCYRTSRGKTHAAPLPSQEPTTPKGQKRITKEERRVRIVEFVENYRASNEGKFPTVTNIRQQLGGCHYAVREILQEMKYNHANGNEPDLVNKQREIEDNEFDSKDSEKTLNTDDSNGGDMVNDAKTHAREDNPKLEESANTGLLGSLKSFAHGIRNFWKNM